MHRAFLFDKDVTPFKASLLSSETRFERSVRYHDLQGISSMLCSILTRLTSWLTTSNFFNSEAFIRPVPCHKQTVNPSAWVSISCFHCIRATTGATTKEGFWRGSDKSKAIVWILCPYQLHLRGSPHDVADKLRLYTRLSHSHFVSQHSSFPRTFFLFPHPKQTLFLERQ